MFYRSVCVNLCGECGEALWVMALGQVCDHGPQAGNIIRGFQSSVMCVGVCGFLL